MSGFWTKLLERLRPTGMHAVRLDAFAKSDRGLERADNQDWFVCRPEQGLLCVADGMGGGSGGALASRWTCEAVSKVMSRPFGERKDAVDEQLEEANARIRAYAKANHFKSMGTTAVGMIFDPANCTLSRVFHVGDSRAYRLRYGRIDRLTRDHTVGSEMGYAVGNSSSEQARALQARSNPLSHILTHAVGTEIHVHQEWRTLDVMRGDRLMFCSDGVHDILDDDEIAECMSVGGSPQEVVAAIEERVRAGGAHDNYTIICAFAEAAAKAR